MIVYMMSNWGHFDYMTTFECLAEMGFAYVCPISNTKRKNLFYVVIPKGEAVTGVIMTEQMRSLDFRARKATYKGVCPELVLQDCLRRTRPIIF
jgi:mRNA interferase MazF